MVLREGDFVKVPVGEQQQINIVCTGSCTLKIGSARLLLHERNVIVEDEGKRIKQISVCIINLFLNLNYLYIFNYRLKLLSFSF